MTSITIFDVAARAGVAVRTVSRVISNAPNVSVRMRERVFAAASDLGFVPSIHARALRGSRSMTIGLLFDRVLFQRLGSYAAEVLSGALLACREHGYHLAIEEIDTDHEDLQQHVNDQLRSLRMDGCIVASPTCDKTGLLDSLDAIDIPYARINPMIEPDRSFCVVVDDWAAARAMTLYLWELGHRRIGFIKGPPHHGSALRRFEGFQQALRDVYAFSDANISIEEGDFSFQSGLQIGMALLSCADRPTAVFASNDDMAAGLIGAATQLHLSVPRDVSVVGFDDSAIATSIWPSLTTVHQPTSDMARTAIGQVAAALAGKHALHRIELPFEIIVRGSADSPR